MKILACFDWKQGSVEHSSYMFQCSNTGLNVAPFGNANHHECKRTRRQIFIREFSHASLRRPSGYLRRRLASLHMSVEDFTTLRWEHHYLFTYLSTAPLELHISFVTSKSTFPEIVHLACVYLALAPPF